MPTMTKRTFSKTVISIEVISEEPIPDGMELDRIVQECRDGDYSMRPLRHQAMKLNGRQAAATLRRQGSSPSFFRLDHDGNDENAEC